MRLVGLIIRIYNAVFRRGLSPFSLFLWTETYMMMADADSRNMQ